MLNRKLSFIGWGFSYQAQDPRTKRQVCDFEFTSGTFNSGGFFVQPQDFSHGQDRELQEKMGDLLKINFNYMRAYNIRTLKDLAPVNDFIRRNDQWGEKIPDCPDNSKL